MKIEKIHNRIRYTLSNDNLKEGDEVFPIGSGRCTDDGWVLHELRFENHMSGFPNEPHIINNIKHSDYKPYEVKTDKGYSPIECYYKIIKMEKQKIKEVGVLFATFEWITI